MIKERKTSPKTNITFIPNILILFDAISLSDKYAIDIAKRKRESGEEKKNKTSTSYFSLAEASSYYDKNVSCGLQISFSFRKKKRSILSSIIDRKYQHNNNNNNYTLRYTDNYLLGTSVSYFPSLITGGTVLMIRE